MPEPGSPTQFSAEAAESQTPETDRDADREIERSFDAFMEQIIQGAEKINEGNNGVILSIDSDNLPGRFIEILKERGLEFPSNEQVVKILKIYREGHGQKEYEAQRRAYEIVTSSGQSDTAGVPKPLLFHELELTEEQTRECLERMGLTAVGERVELILMDRIEGDDLATILYREVIKRHPKSRHLADSAESLSLQDLGEEVARVLNFRIAGGKSRDEDEREFERMKVANQNAEKLYVFLRRTGFRLSPEISKQVANALNAFHSQGLVFRDGHERNIMICGESASATAETPPRSFVVDFGSAKLFEGRYRDLRDELYLEGDRRFISDEYILSRLRSLSSPLDQGGELREEIVSLMERIESRRPPKILEARESIMEEIKKGNLDQAFVIAFGKFQTSRESIDLDTALAHLMVLFRDGLAGAEDLREKLKETAEKITDPGTANHRRLIQFANSIL